MAWVNAVSRTRFEMGVNGNTTNKVTRNRKDAITSCTNLPGENLKLIHLSRLQIEMPKTT